MSRIVVLLLSAAIALTACGQDKSPTAFAQPDELAKKGSLGQRTNLAEVINSFDAYRLDGKLVVVVSFKPDREEAWLGEPLRLVFIDRVDAIGDEVNIVSEEFEGKSIAIVTFRVFWSGSSAQANLLAAAGKDPRQYGDLTFYYIPENPGACYGPLGQKFIWPVKSHHINSGFHDPNHPFLPGEHNGIDIRATQGELVRAIGSGYVSLIYGDGSLGPIASYVEIEHTSELSSAYVHLSRIIVTRGQCVRKGQVIGYSGGTPGTPGAGKKTTGPHLHVEIHKDRIPVDPLDYLS